MTEEHFSQRIKEFWSSLGDNSFRTSIRTEFTGHVVKASVLYDERPLATGHALMNGEGDEAYRDAEIRAIIRAIDLLPPWMHGN